jgi:hypothetical protein
MEIQENVICYPFTITRAIKLYDKICPFIILVNHKVGISSLL